jgi:putative flippase GtrA
MEPLTDRYIHARRFVIRNLRRGGIFLAIGGLGFLVDAAVYNLLVFAGDRGPLHSMPLVAKTLAVLAGLVVTFAGNHLLTYRDRRVRLGWSQILRYSAVNALAILLQLGCLGFSRYVLGLDNALADNVSGTFIGQAIATAMRYVLYTKWVFPHSPTPDSVSYVEQMSDEER